jgi:hypothetical protein
MGDAADDLEMQEDSRARRAEPAMEKLVKWCSSEFPYICTGEKTISADGREVRCECGNGCRNNAEI